MIKKIISFASCVSILAFSLITSSSNKKVSAIAEQPFEVLSMRSQYEKHYDNGDGTYTAIIDTVPIHYNDENGEWVEIDNTLTQNYDGSYTNAKNSMNVTLAPTANVNTVSDINNNKMNNRPLVSLDYMGYNVSWDIINPYADNVEKVSACESTLSCPIEISENNSQRCSEVNNEYLDDNIEEAISSKNSSVWYRSLFDGCDINVEIKPTSIKENMILNNREAANRAFTYYVKTNGLIAELCDDNSIKFVDEEDNIIFFIPAPFMFESESDNVKSYDIDISLEKYENGYLMSYIPNKEWILSEERNFPVIIDPDVYVYDSIFTCTLSESAPTAHITGDTLKIGGYGTNKNRFKALVSVPPLSSLFSNDRIAITNAELYMHFNNYDDPNYQRGLRVSAILSRYTPWWSGVHDSSLSQLDRFELTGMGYNGIDVTSLVNGWYNYVRSNSKVGVYPYGVVVDSYWNNCCVYEVDSSSGTNPPYYTITYKMNNNYTLTYLPEKYNDCGDIYNFSNRMNCYAYALQMYHLTYSQNFEIHKLMPGEIGMSLNNSQFSTSTELRDCYNSIKDDNDFINFTEEQMMLDSKKMGTNLKRITLSNEEQFVLPTGYNENTQRVIAMNTGYNYPSGSKDFHFYVRHGNGSCEQHRGTCSIWSHKRGDYQISNTIPKIVDGKKQNILICDKNIAELAHNVDYLNGLYAGTFYNTPLRFYTIQQDTNVYNSWYEYKSTSDTVSYEN